MADRLHLRIVVLLIEERRSRRITQAELARRLGRSTSFVFRVEAGARHLDVAEFIQLTRAIGVDPYDLLRRADLG